MALKIIRMSPMCHCHCGRYFPVANEGESIIYEIGKKITKSVLRKRKQRSKQENIG
jgi:hypothetical protein